ncbi:MAG: sigma 54-interacting transcriptional regulator [Candidatus Krumholzibacteria bacterium]|nr:sigma 54-interacting transcriptional regulator [Candidatus Krumholzibacteria bacterium]
MRVPSELERQYRRFLNGWGDAAVLLFSFLKEGCPERADYQAWAALVLSRIFIVKGSLDLARAYIGLSTQLFRTCGDGSVPAGLLVNRAVIDRLQGRYKDSKYLLRRAHRLSLERNDPLSAAKASVNLAVVMSGRDGDAMEVSELLGFAITTYRTLGLDSDLVNARIALAFTILRAGRHDESFDHVSSMIGDNALHDRQRINALLIGAEGLLAMEEFSRGSSLLEESGRLIGSGRVFHSEKIRWLNLMSRHEHLVGRAGAAEKYEMSADLLSREKGLVHPPYGDPVREVHSESDGDIYSGKTVFVTRDRRTRTILSRIRKASVIPMPVLIEGESGTGKEILGRMVHHWSGRGDLPFLTVNIAALPADLFESSLFGYVKGAFTGAEQSRVGIFEAAGNGTVFLDEIGELAPRLQSRLLRFLDCGEYIPVGGTKIMVSGARIIAATNRRLAESVKEGGFRKDLYFRLNVLSCELPPLRERCSDLIPLSRYFLGLFANTYGIGPFSLGKGAEKIILRYDWPGNVRELRNELLSAAVKRGKGTIRVADLSERLVGFIFRDGSLVRAGSNGRAQDTRVDVQGILGYNPSPDDHSCLELRLREIERREIEGALVRARGNRSRAAMALGLKRTTLLYRMRRCGLTTED